MNYILDSLVVWGLVSPVISFYVGRTRKTLPEITVSPVKPARPVSDRTALHRHDKQNNPGYRGGYTE